MIDFYVRDSCPHEHSVSAAVVVPSCACKHVVIDFMVAFWFQVTSVTTIGKCRNVNFMS
jgi:hypothetical protein